MSEEFVHMIGDGLLIFVHHLPVVKNYDGTTDTLLFFDY